MESMQETSVGMANHLQLELPQAKSTWSCFCFRVKRKFHKEPVVVDVARPRIYIERFADQSAVDKVNSARYLQNIILYRCGGDMEKFQLVCLNAGIDWNAPEKGITFEQVQKLQDIFRRVFRAPLLENAA